MSDRFHVEPTDSELIAIVDAEARHISKVMRLGRGDQIVLFDGQGRECVATIQSVGKHSVEVEPGPWQMLSREALARIVVASALPKGDRLKFMVEKLTEIGAAELVPIVSDRASVKPTENTIRKMRRHVIEASKQCGRNHLMKICDACTLDAAVQSFENVAHKYICDPRTEADLAFMHKGQPSAICFLIGPEGGFTDQEIERANSAGWISVRLGQRILRIETAAIVTSVTALNFFGGYDRPVEG